MLWLTEVELYIYPSENYVSSFQLMSFDVFSTKPLFEPYRAYCEMDP